MATSGGTASQRDRSRDRSPSRPASGRQAPGVQGAESDRLDRLESQASQLSNALLAPGPTLEQIVQLQQAAAPPNLTPCPGRPTGFPTGPPLQLRAAVAQNERPKRPFIICRQHVLCQDRIAVVGQDPPKLRRVVDEAAAVCIQVGAVEQAECLKVPENTN